VAEVAVVAMPDPRLGERACAFVAVRPGAALTLADLTSHLLARGTAKTYLPERLEVVDALPRTPSGKIQKFKLRERLQAETAT
jgi:cyclohexanecarboxylate-CoA ligase